MESLVIICLYHLASGISIDLSRIDEREYFISLCNMITMTFGCCLSEPIYKWDTHQQKFKIRGHKLSIKGDFKKISDALEKFKQNIELETSNIFGSVEMALLHELEEKMKRLNEYRDETDILTHCGDACTNKVRYFNALVQTYRSTDKNELLDSDREFERKIYNLQATLTPIKKYTYSRFMYYNSIMTHCMTISTAAFPKMNEVVVKDKDGDCEIIDHKKYALHIDCRMIEQCMTP